MTEVMAWEFALSIEECNWPSSLLRTASQSASVCNCSFCIATALNRGSFASRSFRVPCIQFRTVLTSRTAGCIESHLAIISSTRAAMISNAFSKSAVACVIRDRPSISQQPTQVGSVSFTCQSERPVVQVPVANPIKCVILMVRNSSGLVCGRPHCRCWRRGWDSNPRARFWQARRFRGAPVMTASVPLRQWD